MAYHHRSAGLLGLLEKGADPALLASGAIVFGVQRLVPTYDPDWYIQLRKPTWTPKNWVFPAVWIPLKLAQSVAIWLVWKEVEKSGNKQDFFLPAAIFGTHLALGNLWNVSFFVKHQLEGSLKWMGAFWISIAGVIGTFQMFNPVAAALMVPTQIWVTIAAKLNLDIVRLNTKKAEE